MKNDQKGMTLMALAITIMVLLVLSGILIAMIVGKSGILVRSNDSSIDTNLTNVEETEQNLYSLRQSQHLNKII